MKVITWGFPWLKSHGPIEASPTCVGIVDEKAAFPWLKSHGPIEATVLCAAASREAYSFHG